MGMIYTGYIIAPPDDILPEDFLMDILDTAEARAYLQKIVPGAKYNPWNDSNCIAWAVNKALGKKVCTVVNATLEEMISHVIGGGAVGIGGGFLSGGTSGHFVCVVGAETTNDGGIKNIIIDDPYGNYNNNYVNHYDGNDIPIETNTFVKLTFGKSKKKTMQFYERFL
jgi:hypothetical protein